MCTVRVPSNSLRAHSRRMRVAPGTERHREVVWRTLTPVVGADVGRLSFGSWIKVDAAVCGLLPLAGGQSIYDGCLCWDLRDSVVGGPNRYVSGLVFAPTPSPMMKFC